MFRRAPRALWQGVLRGRWSHGAVQETAKRGGVGVGRRGFYTGAGSWPVAGPLHGVEAS